MKKIFSIVAIALFALTLTGCGNSTEELTCTKGTDTAILKIKNNKLVSYTAETTTEFDNETALSMAYSTYQMTASAYNSISGASAEVLKNGNALTVKLTFDFEKMDKETVKDMELDRKAKDIIKDIEEEGYNCKY